MGLYTEGLIYGYYSCAVTRVDFKPMGLYTGGLFSGFYGIPFYAKFLFNYKEFYYAEVRHTLLVENRRN